MTVTHTAAPLQEQSNSTTAYDRIINALRAHGCKVTQGHNNKASSTCPHHEDRNPSLSVTGINGRTLMYCQAGCDTKDILSELRLTMADLYDERSATYRYADGRVSKRYYVDGGNKKKFAQTGALPTSVLFGLETLKTVTPGEAVFLVEGEDDVIAIQALGGVAVSAPQGAGSFHKVDATPLTGHWVNAVVDKDTSGDKWAIQVAEKLDSIAHVRFVRAVIGKDASDHIAAGYDLEHFEQYRPQDAPDWSTNTKAVGDDWRDTGEFAIPDDPFVDEPEEVEPNTWAPQDISSVLAGTFTTPEPDLGFRSDGECMLYSGKEHSIASEPECGKTWWVLMQVRSVLQNGGNVVYVDFEDDANTIVGRLHRVLGVPASDLGPDRFRYVRPEVYPKPALYAALLDFKPALVVLDGVTESMSLAQLEVNSNDSIATWRRMFVRPALAVGAATLSTDHVVKDRDTKGRFALGGGHKLAGLTGAMFKLEQVHAFGKGMRGLSRVVVTKDRNGGLRCKGEPTKDAGITYMGDLVGDSTGPESEWNFYKPNKDAVVETLRVEGGLMPPPKLSDAVAKTINYLKGHPEASTRAVRAVTGVAAGASQDALEWLLSMGHVVQAPGPRSSKLWTLVSGSVTGSEETA